MVSRGNGCSTAVCSWRPKRGPKICSAECCIKPGELEARVLGTIRSQILVPEIVEEVARRSLELAKARFEESHRTLAADRSRLDRIRMEERNLIREMAKRGASDAFYAVLQHLRDEKVTIQTRIDGGQPTWNPGSRDYHIEGTAEPTLEADTAGRPETTGRTLQVVAGARSDRLHTQPNRLLVRMQFGG